MITPEEFLENKGWHKDSNVVGGALWMGMVEMLKEYTELVKESDSLPCVGDMFTAEQMKEAKCARADSKA